MSVRVRLTRVGSKKNPIWRVVVADQRSPRDGRFIEQIGHYNPRTDPSTVVIDRERLDHWIELGAQPTNTVRKLMRVKPQDSADGAAAQEPASEPRAAAAPEAADATPSDAAPAEAGSEPAEGQGSAAGEPSEPDADG